MPDEQQVIVVGGGPTGLLTALGLAQQGIEVTVLERAAGLQQAPRAIVYPWPTLDGLERLDLLEEASRVGSLEQDYAYRVRKTGEVIEYGLPALDADTRAHSSVGKASPRTAANERLLCHSADPIRLDRELEHVRCTSRDREPAAEVLPSTKTLESPSLIGI
ncbi:FAD-dependent oxidoreductase [Blastococcus sp. SYSU D00820]